MNSEEMSVSREEFPGPTSILGSSKKNRSRKRKVSVSRTEKE